MKTTFFKSAIVLLFSINAAFSQVGIGTTTPDSSSMLDIRSTTNNQGILIPTLTKAQISAITNPANGLTVYNSDDKTFSVNVGTPSVPVWKNLSTFDMSNNKPIASAVTLTGTFAAGGTISGAYTYTDNENDAQYNSIGKFYIADDAAGTNASAVSTTYSTTSPRTYSLLTGQLNKYVAFGITPAASAGNSPGTEVITAYTKVIGKQSFAYTGANQTFTVPTGITSVTFKIWGAGGGGSDGSGGSGAYLKGTLAVTPGQVLVIVVGKGGSNSAGAGYGGGGSSTVNGGSGGGYSGIFNTSLSFANALAIAGGGGGGGYYGDATYGGGGGATTGSNGGTAVTGYTSGSGGTVSAGGAGGLFNNATGRSSAGTALTGGNGLTSNPNTGGGGGGGYYGGGSGYCANNGGGYYSSAGGGGSSYTGTLTAVTNTAGTTSSAGLATQAPGNADADYVSGIGNGGDGDFLSTTTTVGGNGLVVITY